MANPNLINVSSVVGGNAGFNLPNTATATLITVDADKICKINHHLQLINPPVNKVRPVFY